MADLAIDVVGVRVEPYAAAPTLMWSLRIADASGDRVHALALHAQVRIEPRRRVYEVESQDRLLALFGPPQQWGASLNPFLWTHLDTVIPGFDAETTVEVPMACSYDFDVAASRYLHALDRGEVPLAFLFSGTVFSRGDNGFSARPVPWHLESQYRLPVAMWRELMDHYFPASGWLRLERPTLERLDRYRMEQALPTWDQAILALFKAAGEDV